MFKEERLKTGYFYLGATRHGGLIQAFLDGQRVTNPVLLGATQ
jgi:hypothetical protein